MIVIIQNIKVKKDVKILIIFQVHNEKAKVIIMVFVNIIFHQVSVMVIP